jgi:hypothetical protein
MSNTITVKRSSVPGKIPGPGDLEYGEFALNYTDGNLFFKNNADAVINLVSTQFVSVTGNVTGGNVVTAGQITATGNITTSGLLTATNQMVIVAPSPSSEGAQIVLAWANISGITGQANSTWNLDVDSSNNFRVFSQNATGVSNVVLNLDSATQVATFTGNVSGNYFIGNGSQLTGIVATASPAGNTNEVQFNGGGFTAASANFTFNGTSATVVGNITGNYFIGNGSQLTGLPAGYANADVAAYLPTYTGNLASLQGNVTTTANVTGNYFIGNGSQLTGLPAGYANADVAAYLPTYTGNLASLTGVVTTTANITGNYFIGNGSQLTSITGGNVTGQVANALVADTVTTAAQPNITSVGTLSSLSVSGNITGGNLITGGKVYSADFVNGGTGIYLAPGPGGYINFFTSAGDRVTITDSGNISAVGNVIGGNLITSGNIISGNANLGNLATANFFSGNGNALFNIQGANVTGQVANALVADTVTTAAQPNITSVGTLTSVSVTGNVVSGNISTANTVAANILTVTTTASIGGNLNMNSQNITSLANPVNAQDAVTKTYVDTLVASGIHFHEPVRVESPINLVATYNNGTAGVGATLTNSGTQAALVIDGITMVVADRVLVYEQTNQTQNGIYVVSDIGSVSTNWILTRSADADTYVINSASGLSEGSSVYVQQGATGAGELYTCNTTGVITFGTTNITFAQISSAQIYSAGTGLALVGTQFSIANTAVTTGTYGSGDRVASFTVNQQGQITSAANTVIAANAANLTGTVLNSSVITSSLTSVGTLSSLSVTGNVTGGIISSTGNIIGGNLLLSGLITDTGQLDIQTSAGNANVVITPNGTGNLNVSTGVSATGNITGGNLITAGLVSLSSIVKTGSNGVGNIGAAASTFNTVFAKATSAQYADVAERYQADADYPVGTVLVIGGQQEVTASASSHDTAVAGVVSENPSYLMNSGLQTANSVPVALLGRVPCQVVGIIRRGDLLVTSDLPGTATALDHTRYLPGCVIGKALADYNSDYTGIIEIAVGVK